METIPSEKRSGRFSTEERERLLAQYRESGQSQRLFCEASGIALATLGVWLRKARAKDLEGGKLIEVSMPVVDASVLEIVLPGGIVVRVPAGYPTGKLRELWGVLRCGA